jgi:hypothetical protein
MEGGVHELDGSTFKECFSLSWRNPYVLRLAFSAGIGGLLFGYDTGAYLIPPLAFMPNCSEISEIPFLVDYLRLASSAERWSFCSCKNRARPFELLIIFMCSGDCAHGLVDELFNIWRKSVCQIVVSDE